MSEVMTIFTNRLYAEWLPDFCNAPHRNYPSDGFKEDSISNLSEFDAHWFLKAINAGLVAESNGFFTAPLSKAKEQIFWQGSKSETPRPITLWVEPIITIGALARLNMQFGWPIERLGMQSKTWAFDLVGYGNTSDQEQMVCEVKKDPKEISTLIGFMNLHCVKAPMEKEPVDSKERNAYRKVQGVRRTWPSLFWALGPRGEGAVFSVRRDEKLQLFYLDCAQESALNYNQSHA